MTATLLHISDTHLGKRQYGSDTRREDFARAFQKAVDIAVEEEVDAVIHSGDLFDSRSPPLGELKRCINITNKLDDAGIPFRAIVGNHDRKRSDQWLDIVEQTGTAQRLDKEPEVIGDVALYGIDSLRRTEWGTEDFSLTPPDNDLVTILCMHQLLTPLAPDDIGYETVETVLDCVNIDLDGLALGDLHEPEEAVIDGTETWYAGSTERTKKSKADKPRTVCLLEIEDDEIRREYRELDVREFERIFIEFSEDDSFEHVEEVVTGKDVTEKVVAVELNGERTSVSSRDVRSIVLDHGAAVCDVADNRGRVYETDEVENSTGDVPSKDEIIDEYLDDEDLSEVALEIESMVQSADGDSKFHETVEQRVEDEQADVFDDAPEVAEE